MTTEERVPYFRRYLKSCFPKTRKSSHKDLTCQRFIGTSSLVGQEKVLFSTNKKKELKKWDTSSVVKACSFIGEHSDPSKLMDVTEPSISRGASDQTKSEAEQTFLRIVAPSSYLQQ